jgi:hypothetical protein
MLISEEQAERQPLLTEESIQETEVNGKSNIVKFDNEDSDNPLDWTVRYRWGLTILMAFMAFTV